MNVKTYQAKSMSKVLEMVKRELGRDAVILHTRQLHRGGWLGFGGHNVVEVTASNDVSIVPPQLRRQLLNKSPTPTAPATSTQELSAHGSGLLQRTYGQPTKTPSPNPTPQLQQNTTSPSPSPTTAADPQLNDEIKQIRQMVNHMMRRQRETPSPDMPDALFAQYLALLEQEVTEELASEVIQNVREELTSKQLSDPKKINEAVSRQVAGLIPVCVSSQKTDRPTDGRPRTIALIGPTGVGKTTTIAKLAATFKLRQNKKVAMITIDTYRIAAVDQLRTYADIIDVPLHVVMTPQEMEEAIARCDDCDVVLIDTAGRSQRDDDKLVQLSDFIKAANPHETHLVLSSTCSQKVLIEAVDRFSCIKCDRIIFTKLDEAVSFGVLLNVVRHVNKQLSYVTMGQEVPHHIEPGQSDRLAQLILGKGL